MLEFIKYEKVADISCFQLFIGLDGKFTVLSSPFLERIKKKDLDNREFQGYQLLNQIDITELDFNTFKTSDSSWLTHSQLSFITLILLWMLFTKDFFFKIIQLSLA